MILILSEKNDITTYHIVKWLEYYHMPSIIITDEDIIEGITIFNKQTSIKVLNKEINLYDIKGYWYRRGFFNFDKFINSNLLSDELAKDISKELSSVSEIMHFLLCNVPNLSSYFNSDLNRICVLNEALNYGFKTPSYIITSNKCKVHDFMSKYDTIICKPIWNGLSVTKNNKLYINHTNLFSFNDLENLPESFVPSLFMEYVHKKYELRVFYLNGKTYTMAILSQNDTQTQIDYRKYNRVHPNRNLCYKLPKSIELKIKRLMQKLKLKTGSIDIIVTLDDEFVFLEVNPIGQFLNVSHTCNYYLEKHIARYLIDITNGN